MIFFSAFCASVLLGKVTVQEMALVELCVDLVGINAARHLKGALESAERTFTQATRR